MASQSFFWTLAKQSLTAGLVCLTITDRYACVIPVRGSSMSPTLNPRCKNSSPFVMDDRVLVEKFCLNKYKFSRGDVVVFRSPMNYKEKYIKRIAALPGDLIHLSSCHTVSVPKGHCWVVGEDASCSLDSTSFGPIPMGVICGRVTHVVWPPQRIGRVGNEVPMFPEVEQIGISSQSG
ncbi:uncharacterized protein LOC127251198 isoform X2 [Andrographis paniculata]|uniref:uncharacterized protein LOC127251198 isoform X2 n=1 Tax=Andrographis paniculata TaxID=175694 RepID=UPI0021E9597F|nr:uncharacterized protein LOC127251198 isoform X2 [Andrographis paniculata]